MDILEMSEINVESFNEAKLNKGGKFKVATVSNFTITDVNTGEVIESGEVLN